MKPFSHGPIVLSGVALWCRGLVALGALLGMLLAPGTVLALKTDAITSFQLDNGLQVILLRESRAPVVVMQLWYRVGSADDPVGKGGLAHMLEHMMFQGTPSVPPGELSKIISRQGGENNAATGPDFTYYIAKIASDRIELILKMEADRMRNLIVQESEFISENKVVQEERRMRIDSNPNTGFMESYRAMVFGDHPYGRPGIGRLDEIAGLQVADMRQFYQQFYAPNNAILVLAGDVEPETTGALVRKHFGPIAATPDLVRPPWKQGERLPRPQRLQQADPRVTVPMFTADFFAPSLATNGDPDEVFALDLAGVILGGGRNSRLYKRLVTDEGVAIDLDVSYGGTALGPETWSLSITPKPETNLQAMEKILFQELANMAAAPVSERELERCKNTIIATEIYSQDSISAIATQVGLMAVNGLDWKEYYLRYPERVRAVTAQQVQQAVQRYLRPELVAVGILLPEKGKGGKP